MRNFVIRCKSASGRITDIPCTAATARDALLIFRSDVTYLVDNKMIPVRVLDTIIGIYDSSWFCGVDGSPSGICLELVE
jgi:hypothetical protein